MRIHAIFLVASILTVALFGTAAAKPAGQGAFLVEYADTVQQLVSQVENSRLVALRYAKHFRTDPSSVLTFYRNELSLFKLPETTSLRVYYLDDSHNIVSEVREFKAGTWVFANKAAAPILELGTGNPLSSTLLTGELPKKKVEGLKASNPNAIPNDKVAVQVLEQQPTELPKLATDNANLTASSPSPSATVASNAGAPTPGAASTGTAGRISSTNWLVPLGVVGAAVALSGGGGGSSAIVPPPNGGGGGTEPPPNGGGTNPPVIPEPMSLLTLAAGVATLAAGIYKRKLQK
ncbi:MAG: hypothetical protein QME62_03335 [Armatimonadota bacterium]|nr:hypothetical protein [Armatimonadota bacterium]